MHLRNSTMLFAAAVLLMTGALVSWVLINDKVDSGLSSSVENSRTRTLLPFGASSGMLPSGGIQELVNHSDALVIATIGSTLSDRQEPPYNDDGSQPQSSEFALPFLRYELIIEEVIVDDGNIRDNSILRISSVPEPDRPKMGERLLLALGVNPDKLSYGVLGDFAAIQLSESKVSDYGGRELMYAKDIGETEFLALIDSAVENRVKRPYARWGRS